MSATRQLTALLPRYTAQAAVAAALAAWQAEGCLTTLRPLYEAVAEAVITDYWQSGEAAALNHYQALFRELEAVLQQAGVARRPIVIAIPVADRPQQLRQALRSLVELAHAYHYGGYREGRFPALSVLIADDSLDPDHQAATAALAETITAHGISGYYLGEAEQRALIQSLPQELHAITGSADRTPFGHKGASMTRNLALLKLAQMEPSRPDRLIYFIDSDQLFCVNREVGGGVESVAAINYGYQLEWLFNHRPLEVVTSAVVGDPPVSPAVMVNTLCRDLTALLQSLAAVDLDAPCQLHAAPPADSAPAAYHDMAALFGFEPNTAAVAYRCPLPLPHTSRAALESVNHAFSGFFDGHHPTRQSLYTHQPLAATLKPARTVYTGNVILTVAALRYFIPFAPLRLRMAGPTLGRILQAELGERFGRVNLPLLHQRTLAAEGIAEFRSGIERQQQQVDLAGEAQRQFWGDVMLFSWQRLLAEPERSPATVTAAVYATLADLTDRYRQQRQEAQQQLRLLQQLQSDWSGALPALAPFLANLAANFGTELPAARHDPALPQAMIAAILAYPQQRAAWAAWLA